MLISPLSRLVGVEVNDIPVGTEGFRFDFRVGQLTGVSVSLLPRRSAKDDWPRHSLQASTYSTASIKKI